MEASEKGRVGTRTGKTSPLSSSQMHVYTAPDIVGDAIFIAPESAESVGPWLSNR